MPKLSPISWRNLVIRLRLFGFEGPYEGAKHPYMVREKTVLTIPNPHRQEISVDLLHKQDGVEQLLEELTSMGTIIVRRAYARWTNANLVSHQNILNRLGFELIHTFHPVSGKNSADIQIVVDVMEYVWRDPELRWIALATGDSDFSPLFRRLREMGRQVIGAGPRSALSESVKSSCSRFLYIEQESNLTIPDEASRASAFDDAADLLEKALGTFDEPANCSTLKNRRQIRDYWSQ